MAGLQQIQAERAARPAFNGPSNNLFLKNGDIAFVHFIGTGNDDDPYLEVFLAHELPPRGEQQWGQPVYCPVLSMHDMAYECPNCEERSGVKYKTKERMRMWFFVYNVLTKTPREGEQLPQVMFGGQPYFNRVLNKPLIWDNSAWRESPLDEIIFQHGTMGNLRNSQFTLRATGESRDRRYKITPVSGSAPLDEAVLAEFKSDIRPLRELMLEEIKPVEVVHRPDSDTPQFQNGAVQEFQPAGVIPQTDPSLLASAPPPDFVPGQPPAAPVAPAPQAAPEPPALFQPVAGTKPNF